MAMRAALRTLTTTAAVGALLACSVLGAAPAEARGRYRQALLTTDAVPIIDINGYRFRDLDRNGRLTPYEDWRLSPQRRAADLLSRLSLAEKAGLMVHGTLATSGSAYDPAANSALIGSSHISTFITRLAVPADVMAEQSNAIQSLAEETPFGIPVMISSDPRNGFSVVAGQTVASTGNTAFPDPIGMAAAGDPRLTRKYADIIRQEYRAVGITEGLSPQADIATEPRWTRINGTFGSDPEDARSQVKAYVTGLQNGRTGLAGDSVAAVVKHWVGYGAQVNGYDSHYYYGRYAAFPGNNFADHIVPFTGAFAADVAGVMPTYSILKDLVYRGHAMEQKGAGFNDYLLKNLLRGRYGFDGVIVSDWGITGNCPQACKDNKPPAFFVGSWGVGMPWGMEEATIVQRFAEAFKAGVDQIGGSNQPQYVLDAVNAGLITTARVNQSARRVLVQKFELGLFEHPFVDPDVAAATNNKPAFQRVGDAAQAKSLTLLKNAHRLLPVSASKVKKVFLYGVAPEAAQARGLTVVTDPTQADLAIVRLTDPRGGADLTDLNFTGSEADYQAMQAAVDADVPVVAVPNLSRPLILGNVADRAEAVLAHYGVSDKVLLQTIFGKRAPGGKLPFELPRSMAAVTAQFGDVPDDTAAPLYPVGFGLRYRHHGGRP